MKALLYQLDAMSRKLVAGVMEDQRLDSMSVSDRDEALSAVRSGSVDVVLADIEKDGLELIRAIRAHERKGHARVPVIALAIAYTPGSKRQCEEVGADAVLPIPVRTSDLADVLNQAVGEKTATYSLNVTTNPNIRPALDIAAALERVEGDRELLEELLRLFVNECQGTLRQIRDSWSSHDVGALGRLAHTLKGSSANVGANELSQTAFVLERLARSGNLENAVQHIAHLEREIERLGPELDSFLKQTTR